MPFETNHRYNFHFDKEVFGTYHAVAVAVAAASYVLSSELTNNTLAAKNLLNFVVNKDTGILMAYRALSRGPFKEI